RADRRRPRAGAPEPGAGLEVLGRDLELGGEAPQGLDRGLAAPGLDARDIGVRDPRRGELPLGEASGQPESLQARANGLLRLRPTHESPILDIWADIVK